MAAALVGVVLLGGFSAVVVLLMRGERRAAGPAALLGVVSGVLGLGVAEVVAGFVAPSSAPLVALGDALVDAVPPRYLRRP